MTSIKDGLQDLSWVGAPPDVAALSGRARRLVRRRRGGQAVAGLAVLALLLSAVSAVRPTGQPAQLISPETVAPELCPSVFTRPPAQVGAPLQRLFPDDVNAFTVCFYDDLLVGPSGMSNSTSLLRLSRPVPPDQTRATAERFARLRTDVISPDCLKLRQRQALIIGERPADEPFMVALTEPCGALLSSGFLTVSASTEVLQPLLDLGALGTSQVAGQLVAEDGESPLAGVGSVTITAELDDGSVSTRPVATLDTDAAGRFLIYLQPGRYVVVGRTPAGPPLAATCKQPDLVVEAAQNRVLTVPCKGDG